MVSARKEKMINKKPLEGKFALITGSSSQLGHEFCKILALNGATLIITDIEEEKCKNVLKDIEKLSNKKHYITKLDIKLEDDVHRIIEFIKENSLSLDILINSAGKAVFSSFTERTKEEFMDLCETNIYGTFNCIQKFSNFMISKGIDGSIINIGSIYGMVSGDPRIYTDTKRNTSEIYAASKSAIIQMTKYFAVHLAKYSIRVNCISPGGVYNNQGPDFVKNYSSKTPKGRMAEKNEISEGILYLADNRRSSYVTGHNLVIDGGFTSW